MFEQFGAMLATGLVALAASSSLGQVHAGDILLTRTSENRIELGSGPSAPQRVFVTEFGAVFPNYTDTPGFDCVPDTFPTGSRIGFRIQDTLKVWSAGGFFEQPQETITIAFSSLSRTTPLVSEIVEGFTLAVGSNGTWHRHLEFNLNTPSADGVYLLELTLFSTSSLILESEPFWMIFGNNADPADLEAARMWVIANLVDGGASCDSLDFNGDGNIDPTDVDAYFSVLGEGPCIGGSMCLDLDFNNDGNIDPIDVDAYFSILGEGPCLR